VYSMIKILRCIGVDAEFIGNDLRICADGLNSEVVPFSVAKELRSSVFMLGVLLAKNKRAEIPYPGGCEIGLRPIDMHVASLKSLGVVIEEDGGKITCDASNMKSGVVYLDFPSVGATENLMLASVFTKGETIIKNCAKEPEIVDLMNFLNGMGAKVSGAGTDTIKIDGVKRLHGTIYKPIPDRIEAGTFIIATAITGGEVEIFNVNPENISSLIHKLCNNTCKISLNNDIIYLKCGRVRKAFTIETNPYPGFPTDLQSQMTALASISKGTSFITENVFEMRFKYAQEMVKMGADVKLYGRTAIVKGVKGLHGATVCAPDLRGGAALILCALVAEGKTVIEDIKFIERGYAEIDKKFQALGVNLIRKS